ncbi:hypothetical protein AXG93_2590s1010 [Marchantia polymorpha subsp. ruderalis]|uniref:Uncharacterized protein n=1 Tax=Marchantia polymorpha subsp. ruderalis TaxID=1480154 RepID=A0A176VS06_MARPO|nr:hypothetical protein AXG93_2590s1010 [Marchantia polymorpha subsp. ruderalis]
MVPYKTKDTVRKLVLRKMPYEELRHYRRELIELHLDFLLWNWNFILASICKEIMDKNRNDGEDLRGNPMPWTIEHWASVMGPCAGNVEDLMFEKDSVGFFERIMKGNQVHWRRIFYDLVWVNASSRWEGSLMNHLIPYLVNFYQGMVLLTEEEKRFLKEWEVLVVESSERTEEEDNSRLIGPPQTTAGGPVQVDVLPMPERPERRLAKRRKTQFVGSEDILQPKSSEELVKELTLSEAILEQIVAEIGGIVGNITEFPKPPSPEEEVRSEVATKTSEEGPKTLEIDFPDFLLDSVVPLLKYLDKKREKYIVRMESGSYVELIRNRTKLKRAVAVKWEWDSSTAMAKERAASLAAECAVAKVTLQEQEDRLRAKEMECEVTVVLCGRLEKSKEAYEATMKRARRLITTTGKREQMHADELAKVEERRAEEARIAEDLWGKIAAAKTGEEELRSKIAELTTDPEEEFTRAKELTVSLAEEFWKHEGELTDLAKKLADCESARSSEVECRLKVESERRRLQEQLRKAGMRSEESQRRMEKAEVAYR